MKHYSIIGILSALLLLSACQRDLSVDVAYAPQSILEIDARVTVEEFNYTPPLLLDSNEIKISELVSLRFPSTLGIYYKKALQKEFRFSGISLKEGSCKLTGTLHKLLSTFRIVDIEATHVLRDKNSNIIYSESYSTRDNIHGLINQYSYASQINNIISSNIGQMLDDEKFREALEKC